MTPSLVAATVPLVAFVLYAAIAEAFRLGVAWAHYCLERFEEQPTDWGGAPP